MHSAYAELKGHVSPRFISWLLCGTGWEEAVQVALHGWRGEGGKSVSGGGVRCRLFFIYHQRGGYTNNSVCFSTHAHANLPSYSLFLALVSHSPWQFDTQYISVTHSISLSFSLLLFSFWQLCFLFTSSKQCPFSFPSISLLCRLLLCRVFVPWLDLASALSHLAMSVDVCCRCSLGILGKALRLCRCIGNHISCA